jgi:hypothetical protein
VVDLCKSPLLRRSLNYRSLLNGHAYPLFYDTLFADLRSALTTAADTCSKLVRRSRRDYFIVGKKPDCGPVEIRLTGGSFHVEGLF